MILLIVAVRTVILYALVLLAVRLMGKAELSKMSPFQMVIVFLIAELAAIPIDDPSVSLANGIAAIFTLVFLQVLLSFLSTKSERFKNFLSGRPSILIEKGKINVRELKNLRITITDLTEQLRLAGCPSISDVRYAILESNGQMTVIPRAGAQPLTPRTMGVAAAEGNLPVILVSDGTLYPKNLLLSGLSEPDFQHMLKSRGIHTYRDIFLAFCDEAKKIHVYLNTKDGQSFAPEVKL